MTTVYVMCNQNCLCITYHHGRFLCSSIRIEPVIEKAMNFLKLVVNSLGKVPALNWYTTDRLMLAGINYTEQPILRYKTIYKI